MQNIENYPTKFLGDRFIPQRKDNEALDFKIMKTLSAPKSKDAQILQHIFPFIENNILNFGPSKDVPLDKKSEILIQNLQSARDDQASLNQSVSKIIKKGETSVLQASGFKNDYYLHLLDAHNDNLIGVILASTIFLLDKKDQFYMPVALNSLYENSFIEPTSINFNKQVGSMFGFGNANGDVKLFDWELNKIVSNFKGHGGRVGSIQFNPSKAFIFASGSKDNRVIINDIRDASSRQVGVSHIGEVCGLSWNSNGMFLASGGNDNLVNIWDVRRMKFPLSQISDHKAAIRALDWCPWKSELLASGGGSGDMQLIITNVYKNKIVKQIKTNSQICALLWDEDVKGIMTAHGFSRYQLSLWKYSTSELLYEFVGHQNRILSMVRPSASGDIITGSADETVRVWNLRSFVRPFMKNDSKITPLLLR